jgi:hypothetical protein
MNVRMTLDVSNDSPRHRVGTDWVLHKTVGKRKIPWRCIVPSSLEHPTKEPAIEGSDSTMFSSIHGRIRQLYPTVALLIAGRQLLLASVPASLSSYYPQIPLVAVTTDLLMPSSPALSAEVTTETAADYQHSTNPTRTNTSQQTLHVLYGLSGNISEFLDEFVVSLKSVLLNAPLDNAMDVHLIVDSKAHAALTDRVFPRLKLEGSKWRNPISIYLYPVSETMKASFGQRVQMSLPGTVKDNITIGPRVGPGGLFRLFAHEILPQASVESVLYLDNDVVVMANLAEILHIQNATYMYQIGVHKDDCSGLMILNVRKFASFFEYLKLVEPRKLLPKSRKVGDQLMLHRVKEMLRNALNEDKMRKRRESALLRRRHNATSSTPTTRRNRGRSVRESKDNSNTTHSVPEVLLRNISQLPLIGDLPPEWHVHLAHGYRRKTQWLRQERPNGFAMLHFNGKRANSETWWSGKSGIYKYCTESEDCKTKRKYQQAFRQTWNLAEYYVHLPFEHALYLGSTLARTDDGGVPLVIRTRWCPASEDMTTGSEHCRVASS